MLEWLIGTWAQGERKVSRLKAQVISHLSLEVTGLEILCPASTRTLLFAGHGAGEQKNGAIEHKRIREVVQSLLEAGALTIAMGTYTTNSTIPGDASYSTFF